MATGGNELKEIFDKYAKFGKTEVQHKDKDVRIESKNIQKMMKDGGIIDSKYTSNLLDNDIARVLGRLSSNGTYPKGIKTFELKGFQQLINQIAESKKTTADKLIEKISSVNAPSFANVTGVANKEVTDRMTDTTHYTGSHRERFDVDGHGKGKDGRDDLVKTSGYVGNYKGEGTYDTMH